LRIDQLKILVIPGNDWIFGPKQYLNDIVEIMAEKHDIFVWHFDFFRNRKPFLKKIENVKLIHPWSVSPSSILLYYISNFIPHSIQFVREVKRLGIDVVVVLNLIPALWGFALLPTKTLKVYGFQDYFPESASVYYRNYPKTLRRILESLALLVNKLGVKLADLTLCPCFSLINLSQKMGCKKNYFLPNGVDTTFYTPFKSDEKLRKKLGLSKHTLVFFGLIEGWLDFDTILDGLRILKEEFPDVKLLIVGAPLTDYDNVLKKMLRDANLINYVVMTGYVPESLVPYYLNLGSICLMPYKVDTFSGKIRLPLKFFIYSAMGKPILSVSLPEVKRLKPKHVFYYYDKTSFARNASTIFSNEKLQDSLRRYARNFAKNFDYSRLAQECEAIFVHENLKKNEN